MEVEPRAGPERVGAREKAVPGELGCGMRMEGAHRHEIKTSGMYTGEARVG